MQVEDDDLARFAGELRDCGVRRVNVSLDTLDPETFRRISVNSSLEAVFDGIAAADYLFARKAKRVLVLAGTDEGMRRAVMAGAETIEHGDSGTAEIFKLMAERHVDGCDGCR